MKHASGSEGISLRNLNHMARHICVVMNRNYFKVRGSNPPETRILLVVETLRSNLYKS